jgi:hypothetical protein
VTAPRAIAGVAVFAAAFAAQAWLRPGGGGAIGATRMETSVSALAGALRPLFVAMTWTQAEAALEDHRLLEALDRLRLLEAADPAAWQASVFRAHVIAHDLAEREEPDARADRVVEAVLVLEAAARRTPEPAPLVSLGQLLLEPRMWEPGLSKRLERRLRDSPRERALAALEEASRRAPSSERILRLVMEAARLRGIELLVEGAPVGRALQALDRAGALAAVSRADALGARLAAAWSALAAASARSGPAAIETAGAALVATLSAWSRAAPPTDDFEAALAAKFTRRAVAIAGDRLASGDGAAALSIAGVVHTIRNFVADRPDRTRPEKTRDLVEQRRVLALVDEISRKNPDLQARCSEMRELVLAW